MADQAFDLIVIGAGPGGYVAASHAAHLGLKVACVDKGPLGGTCLNVGCIPSKALLESSELYYQNKKGLAQHGISLGEVGLDLGAMMQRKAKIVQTMNQGIAGLFRQHKVEFVAGAARLSGSGKVQVGERVLAAPHILLATGSVPVELPGLPFDGKQILSSTEALAFDQVPERLLVIGAGAIGLELGSVWSRLGSQVKVIEYMDQILPGMDREMAGQLQRLLQRQGLSFQLQASAKGAEVGKDGVKVQLESAGKASTETADAVLVAVGRRPCAEGLGLEAVGVIRDQRGRVQVDDHFQTNIPGLYAIGDLIPGPMLAHKAEAEGHALAEALAGHPARVNYQTIPSVVYTHPELASVGLSEEAAVAQGRQVRVGKHLFRANGRAHCMDQIDGLVKVLADARTDRILGVHVLGPQASHLIGEAVVAMEFAGSAEDLARTVHAHPSLSEVLKEAAWAAMGS
ncbi:MAG: dihydrolipoyl dehydrogenase [Candidatus Latescibacteria bacterium]|nr:dihydrolipoyl dehydrogenase [Candidatus Latescibacterota bacterium]